jgi:hypothetical protein
VEERHAGIRKELRFNQSEFSYRVCVVTKLQGDLGRTVTRALAERMRAKGIRDVESAENGCMKLPGNMFEEP